MTRGWKVGLSVAAGVVLFNLLLVGLRSLSGGTPGGPTSSSYATGSDGDAAYASLLARAGHRVDRSRRTPSEELDLLDPQSTVFLLDPPFVARKDAEALRTFVGSGGRLVLAPGDGSWLDWIVDRPPVWSRAGIERARALAPAPEVAGVSAVSAAGRGTWSDARSTLPLLGGPAGAVAAVATQGSGHIVLLADASPLQNAYLAREDNAAFALDAAGPASRRVVFLETYHGYGRASGLSAIPARWTTALLLGSFAALVFMASRVRRFGPPEADARQLPPPRAHYVESLAATLTRARDRDEALAPLRAEVRRRVAARSGLRADADDAALAAAATRLGLDADEVRAVTGGSDELALGRALARTAERRVSEWMS
jgi:hypothetical protein